jgi:hypothetical protein
LRRAISSAYYRSPEHADVLSRSKEARAVGPNITAFADAIIDITRSDATTKVRTARDAIATFEAAPRGTAEGLFDDDLVQEAAE